MERYIYANVRLDTLSTRFEESDRHIFLLTNEAALRFHFYTPWNHQKASVFVTFSREKGLGGGGGIEFENGLISFNSLKIAKNTPLERYFKYLLNDYSVILVT